MKIASTQYTLRNKALEIYISGCKGFDGHCKGCHNPELFDFNIGTDFYDGNFKHKFVEKLKSFDKLIDRIFILGGEPLDQESSELLELFVFLKRFNKEIWLFTHYELDFVPNEIKELCDFIKTGRFIEGSEKIIRYGIELASSNQNIFKKGDHY